MTSLLFLLCAMLSADAARIKDIADLYGVRGNTISGVGLVTGLNRTGDSTRSESTVQMLVNRLKGYGLTLSMEQFRSRNVAVVMVNAWLPGTARSGQRIDVEVSSIGDATSLEGGVLQLTPLFALDGETYAVAQGPLVIGGFSVEQGGSVSRKNHPTVGRVPAGAMIERETPDRMEFVDTQSLDWMLREPDFTTAQRLAETINTELDAPVAIARDASAVAVNIPDTYAGRIVDFIARVELFEVEPDMPARVTISEKTGTVVMGADVRISSVAVAHGGLSIEVRRRSQVSQPGAFSSGETVVVPDDSIETVESEGQLTIIGGVTLGELVAALNRMGVKPRDLVAILMAIQAAGALHAQLEVI